MSAHPTAAETAACDSAARSGVRCGWRDAGLAAMILVLPDTPANRLAVVGAASTLRPSFPLDTRAVLAALRAGECPGANGIVFA